MKIVVSGYVGKKITGIGRNIISLLENNSDRNQYVIYINKDMADSFVFKKNNIIIKQYNVSKNSSMGNLLWTTFIFPFKVLAEHADMALIPNFTLLLFKLKPTVVIIHDLIEFNIPNKFSKLKMFYRTKIADPITAFVADKIITVSNNSQKDIMKFLGVKEDKISVIYNGVDKEKFIQTSEENAIRIIKKRNWPSKFILYAGTIDHPGKNVMGVIQSYEMLRKKNNYDGALILAGMPGAGYEVVEKYIDASSYINDIVLTGYVTDEELTALYSMCDVFCFLSLYEGFGIPPLEALACGAKVIVSNSSSLPEVVGEVGDQVDPYSIVAIYNQMKNTLKKDKKDFNYIKCVNAHIEKFNWAKLSSEFEEVFQSI